MESLYLCSPLTSDHVQELVEAMQTGPLDDDEEQHLLFLGMLAQGKASMASATGSPSRP